MDTNKSELEKNVEAEISMANEMLEFIERAEMEGQGQHAKMFYEMVESLRKRIKFVNNSIPMILNSISTATPLSSGGIYFHSDEAHKKEAEKRIFGHETTLDSFPKPDTRIDQNQPIRYKRAGSASDTRQVLVTPKDKELFFKELDIAENLLRRLKKRKLIEDKKVLKIKKPSAYGRLSNKYFFDVSDKWMKRGYFKSLSLDLKRSNLNILTTTYISMMLLSMVISVILGILIFVFFMFFSIGIELPIITIFDGNYFVRFGKTFWLIFGVPALTFLSFYFFPGAEKDSIGKRIDQELPFLVIHMSSISGSGIEPSQIFKITGTSKEYKFAKKEIQKILNQINIYGYDLSTALRNVALATPSSKLSELLNGISITINSGGEIQTFFEKRGESLLLEYRLEREKFTKTAETFMDIYISIVIAAPMILLMLLVMISVSGLQTGFSIGQLTFAVIGLVGIMNVIFLTFLHLKQPTY